MNLIEAFDKNLISWLDGPPDKIIETIVSKLYFYGDKVYKVYKYEKYFFGDFGFFDFRKNFYEDDFAWNHAMAPDVYLNLRGVEIINNQYKLTNLSKAEDFYIEMKKINVSKNLTNLLLKKQASKKDLTKITTETILRVKKLTNERKSKSENLFKRKLKDMHKEDLESDRNLLYMISSYMPKAKTDEIIDFLKKTSEKNNYFEKYDSKNFLFLIDNHSDNIILFENKIGFIDVLPPKESWRVGNPCFIICRLATDVAVLFNDEKAELIYKTYEIFNGSLPKDIRAIYEIRSALIQIWCFYSQKKIQIAEKYLKFAENKVTYLKNLQI
ncbi:MAG: hypothetical protein AAB352_00260 [Patescibacteria group bacterium]